MTAADPLAAERFRTIVAEAIDKPGMDAPWQEAEPIVDRFPDAYFEHRTNEHGVRVRRVVVASEWEVDPTSQSREMSTACGEPATGPGDSRQCRLLPGHAGRHWAGYSNFV